MITIETLLVSECKTLRKKIQIEFEDTEWAILETFHAEAERLRASKFVQEGQGGSISVNINSKSGLTTKAKPVDVEALSAMLHRARPFLLNDEQVYFYKVLKLMKWRTRDYSAFMETLKAIKAQFELTRMYKFKAFGNLGNIPTSPQVVMDWLNAHEYHRDPKKRDKLGQSLGAFGKDQNGAPVVLFVLVDMIQAVLNLSDCVENLMEAKSREFELICPLELID